MLETIKAFFLIYFISTAAMYFVYFKSGRTFVLPGDIYKIKGSQRIYVPLGGPIALTIIIFLILRTFR